MLAISIWCEWEHVYLTNGDSPTYRLLFTRRPRWMCDYTIIHPFIHSFIFIDQFQLWTMHRLPSSLWALCQHQWTSMVRFKIVVPFQLSLCQMIQEQVERSTITRQPSRAPIVWPTWLWWSTIDLASDEWLLEQGKGTISCTPLTINRVHDVLCKVINVNWFAQ